MGHRTNLCLHYNTKDKKCKELQKGENEMAKKYYWLKLKEDFFEEKQIRYLRKLPDGDKLVIAYLKMQLKSLRTEGFIKYDQIMPNNEEELAMILDEDINIIKLMIQALIKVKAIEVLDDGSFYLIAMQDLVGKEGESAERVRRFRERQNQKMLQCNTNVTECNTEIEIEKEIKKEKEIEKDKEKKRLTEIDELINDNFTDKEIIDTIYEFIKMRKAIKKPLTTRGLQLMIKKLYSITTDVDEQIEILNNSIMNNWQGIFPLKQNKVNSFNDFEELYKEAKIQDEQTGNNTSNSTVSW
jgi:predicted phage replisome organizer